MPSPGKHWIAGAVHLRRDDVRYNVRGETVTATVVELQTRVLVVMATNPAARRTTVRLELRPDFPEGPRSPLRVSSRSLVLEAQQTAAMTITPTTQQGVLLSVRLHSDQPFVPSGEVVTERTWDFRAGPEDVMVADSQPLSWYSLPHGPLFPSGGNAPDSAGTRPTKVN